MSAPRRIALETERFALRGLTPADATPRMAGWLADPEIAGPLNVPAAAQPLDEVRAQFGSADGLRRFMVGIRPRGEGVLIGYYRIDADPAHRTATFNVVVGEREWWGAGVVLETRAALLTEMFERRGIEKAIGQPPARNVASVFNYQRQGWRQEGILRGHARAHDGSGRLDQVQFGLLAAEWAAR